MDKETASADFLEGDGWSHDYQLAHALLGAASNRDAKKVLELVAAGAPLGDAYCHAHSRSDLGTLQFLLEVCGRTPVNSRSVLGWTRVAAAGGLRAYEKAHRRALAMTLTRVVFPRLPVDVVSHVVAFSFHAGYY